MKTERITTDISRAAATIKKGGLIAVPTETVYGLAGNGLDHEAVEKIYEVKGRPAVKPLSLMVPGPEAIDQYCRDIPEEARFLAERFWPGPLTIVLRRAALPGSSADARPSERGRAAPGRSLGQPLRRSEPEGRADGAGLF